MVTINFQPSFVGFAPVAGCTCGLKGFVLGYSKSKLMSLQDFLQLFLNSFSLNQQNANIIPLKFSS